MPLQMVMKIDGISGESKSYRHKGWSEVLSWNWGMTSNRKSSQSMETDKTSLNELSIIKPIGIDSGSIRLLFAEGKTIPSVELSITPLVGKKESPTNYVHIAMQDVVIKSVITSGGIDDAFFKEHITLLFDRINFDCSHGALSEDSSPESHSECDFGWNVGDDAAWKL